MKSEKLKVLRESRNVFRDLRHENLFVIDIETGVERWHSSETWWNEHHQVWVLENLLSATAAPK